MFYRLKEKPLRVFAALGTMGLSSACLSPEENQALVDAFNPDLIVSTAPTTSPVLSEDSCFSETYYQPEAQISKSIDILFVMDTSGSMDDNRAKVATGISSFVSELPQDVDYRIGVMLAHGSRSSWSGKLFTYNGRTVFDSKVLSISTIQSELKTMVLQVPKDSGSEQGEEGSFSLLKGLTTNLDLNRSKGLFRTDAALAVIFVSDENDICAPYVNNPTMPGLTSAERTLRNRDCAQGISTDSVVAQIKAVQGVRPYLVGAVVHEKTGYSDTAGNDGYGWGYMEIVQTTNGVSTEINDGDYTLGLSNMGKLATVKLQLIVDHVLERSNVDGNSIKTYVDGVNVDHVFDSSLNEVHLSQGGLAQSRVDITYCQKMVVPTPTPRPTGDPSPNPTPTPSASPSSTPSPTPSATPSQSPSPTPSATPSPTPSASPSPTPSVTPSSSPSPTPSPSPSTSPPECNGITCGVFGT